MARRSLCKAPLPVVGRLQDPMALPGKLATTGRPESMLTAGKAARPAPGGLAGAGSIPADIKSAFAQGIEAMFHGES